MKQHKKVWELQHTTVCKIVGMSLDRADLKRIFRKFGLRSQDSHLDEEFALHSAVVHMCGKENNVSKHVQKMIEKRFGPYAKRLAMHDSEQLAELVSHGPDDTGVPLWAILWHFSTSRLTDGERLETALFGHIHMLEHELLKNYWKKAAEEHDKQEVERDEQINRIRRVIVRLRSANVNLERVNRRLTERLKESNLAPTPPSPASAPAPGVHSPQHEKIRRLEHLLQESVLRYRKLENECRLAKGQIEALTRELVARGSPAFAPCEESAGETRSCPMGHCLQGRRIAMVGGIDSLEAHYRNLVEQSGGEFCRHDGRCCHGDRKLEQFVRNADLVVCPVSVNSHFGATGVKRLCRKHGVNCCFPDSAGLGSLRSILFTHFLPDDDAAGESSQEDGRAPSCLSEQNLQ